MYQRTKILTAMYETSHPRDDVDRLYESKKEEGDLPTLKITSMH